MLGYSVSTYLSRFQIASKFWGEKIIPLLDYTFSNNYVNKEELSQAFYEIADKYVNTTKLSLRSIRNLVREMGYGYILDFFNPDEDEARRLIAFLIVIHFLKGSRKGLELCLDIMKIKGVVTEWFETEPLGVVDTFTITIDASTLTNNYLPETYRSFETFVKNYVYPEVKFIVVYEGLIDYKIYSDVQGTMIIKYPCYIDATDLGLELQRTITKTLVTDIEWDYTNCYKDDFDRIVPNSSEEWRNLGTLIDDVEGIDEIIDFDSFDGEVWRDTGLYFGVDGIWGNPCVSYAEIESDIIDTGEVLNTRIVLNYTIQKFSQSSNIYVKIRTSEDNITWSDYNTYISTIKPLRYYQIKVQFYCNSNRLAILSA